MSINDEIKKSNDDAEKRNEKIKGRNENSTNTLVEEELEQLEEVCWQDPFAEERDKWLNPFDLESERWTNPFGEEG